MPQTRGRSRVIRRASPRGGLYAAACISMKVTYLHRLVWSLSGGIDTREVDHVDTDGLNCRRENLRAATRSQNTRNSRLRRDSTSGFKGVRRDGNKWAAGLYFEGETVYLRKIR